MTDRLPPHDAEAEAGALGCVLINPEHLRHLHGAQFYDERHRVIFDALKHIESRGYDVDTVSLHQYLKAGNLMTQAGGLEYVQSLPDQTPSDAHFPSWLDTLRDFAARRKILADAAEATYRAFDLGHPVEARNDLPEIQDAAEFIAAPLTQPEELVCGVLHKGAKLVLGGGSKSFKTWTLLDLALSVSEGKPWLSFETTPGRVLYLNFEIQPWSWQARIKAVAEAKQIDIKEGRISLWNLRGKASNFETLLPQIAPVAAGYSLIVLDPIYKLYGGTDENKAGDVARLLNAIEKLAVETGAAVAFGAHFSKGNQSQKESIDRISGSGVFARDPDSLLVFTKHEDEDCFTVEATLRNFPAPEPFVVRWQYPLMTVDPELDPARLKQAVGKKRSHDPLKLLSAIEERDIRHPVSVSEWARLAGVQRPTLYEYLEEMRLKGWIATDGQGNSARKYITNKGKEALSEYHVEN